MKALPILAATMVLLAGCGAKDSTTTYACKFGGKTVDLGSESRPPGFDPESLCPQPIPPSVVLGSASYTVPVYGALAISWSVLPGNLTSGHTMLTSVRLSHHSMPASELTGPDSYGIKELVRMEHQNIPAGGLRLNLTTAAGAFTPDLVGIRYLRAYATVRGDGLEDKDFWSDEVTLNVTPVQPTGKVWTVTHKVGGFQGGLDPATVQAKLGDALSFANADVVDHTFTLVGKPANCQANGNPIAVGAAVPAAQPASPPELLVCPGAYAYETDDVPEKLSISINVSQA